MSPTDSATITAAVITAMLTAIVTAISWLVSYRQSQTAQRTKERLDLVNKQLSEFYGPLHVACVAGEAAVDALQSKLGLKGHIFTGARNPTKEELDEWFHWMKHVLTPLNDIREKIILEKLHLIREEEAPSEILTFAAHVATYRALLAKWEKGDFNDHYAHIEFPEALDDYAKQGFAQLKQEQARLLGMLRK